MKQTYPWKRFWVPRGKAIDLSDGGYLRDPESEWGRIAQPSITSLEKLSEIPCLILLGEPGSGKTETVRNEYEQAIAGIKSQGDDHEWIDLRSYGSEDRLVHSVFESRPFTSWVQGTHRLHLFLDSFDECLLRIDTLAALLIDELRQYPVGRLSLRIACRTADWPTSLEQELGNLWKRDNGGSIGVYELVALRQVDVVEAARINKVDPPQDFLKAVEQRGVVPFAIKPITLDFLLAIYSQTETLPTSQAELYYKGCLALCTETNTSRLASRRTGILTPEARLVVAARVAAMMIFTNTSAIWTSLNQSERLEEDMPVSSLCGGEEGVQAIRIPVTQEAIEEVLDTGLFSSRGAHRLGWAHKTYAEHLAAYDLVQHKVTFQQVMSLIVHPDDPEGKIIPQLHETTAWLAGMQPHLFEELVKRDPDVLLQSDVAVADEKGRADFIETLLQLGDEDGTLHLSRHSIQQYSQLTHPHLEEQLGPYLRDQTTTLSVWLLAIKIAEACEVQALQYDLVKLALDMTQPLPVREAAAHAVVHMGNESAKAQLKVLAMHDQGDDPNDQLKGYGLQAAWSQHMTAKELFSVLTQPKKENFYGAYQSFLSSHPVRHVEVPELPFALEWTEKQLNGKRQILPFDVLGKARIAIMIQAWNYLDRPEVLQGFARAILASLDHYHAFRTPDDDALRTRIMQDDQKRHIVLEALFHRLVQLQKDPTELLACEPSFLFVKDIPWLLDVLCKAEAGEIKRVIAQLLWRICNVNDAEQMSAIFVVCETSLELASEFAPLLVPVVLKSPEAQKMKEGHKWSLRAEEAMQVYSQRAASPVMERIVSLLRDCEQGDIAAWERVVYELTYRSDGTPYEEQWNHRTFPGWKDLNKTLKMRMIEIAKRYVREQDLKAQEWRDSNEFPFASWVMYKSLQLLWQEVPQEVFGFPVQIWKQVAPAFLLHSTPQGVPIDRELLTKGYKAAPAEIIEAILLLIDIEDRRSGQSNIIQKMEPCWDDCLAQTLLEKLQDNYLSPQSVFFLLRLLLSYRVEQARVFAASLIPLPLPLDQQGRSKALAAAQALATFSQDAGWPVLWPVLQHDANFGLQVLSQGAYDPNLSAMTEDQVADVYIWLVRQRPPSRYPLRLEGHVGATDRLPILINTLLLHLQHRGTFKSCAAIRRIMKELPEQDLPYMPWVLREAQTIARRRTWVPPRAEELLQVIRRQEARLVYNGDHLLEILIESLERLESKLQGETPAAIDVWNDPTDKQTSKKVYTPKDENRFSDYVKRHFDEDLVQRGVIVNREVVLRAGSGGSSAGERTDIHVDAITKQLASSQEEYRGITVIIEVKGCWHKEVNRAMQTQLVDRYLKENSSCQHGLYLVGWFMCKQWSGETDYRKEQSPKLTLDEAQKQFDTQAASLSQQGRQVKAFVMNTALR